MRSDTRTAPWAGVAGGLLGGAGVALSAYAAHAATPESQRSLFIAAALALVHGVLLVCWPPGGRRLGGAAAAAITLGVALFAGSLVAGHVFGTSTRFVPAGGMLLIAGWLLLAVARGRG